LDVRFIESSNRYIREKIESLLFNDLEEIGKASLDLLNFLSIVPAVQL
jgi:hypothetical protein